MLPYIAYMDPMGNEVYQVSLSLLVDRDMFPAPTKTQGEEMAVENPEKRQHLGVWVLKESCTTIVIDGLIVMNGDSQGVWIEPDIYVNCRL